MEWRTTTTWAGNDKAGKCHTTPGPWEEHWVSRTWAKKTRETTSAWCTCGEAWPWELHLELSKSSVSSICEFRVYWIRYKSFFQFIPILGHITNIRPMRRMLLLSATCIYGQGFCWSVRPNNLSELLSCDKSIENSWMSSKYGISLLSIKHWGVWRWHRLNNAQCHFVRFCSLLLWPHFP